MRINFISASLLSISIALGGCAVAGPQGAASEGVDAAETADGKADDASADGWRAGTATSWRRAMNAVQYVNVPSGSLEEGGVCSGGDTTHVTLAALLSEQYFSPLLASGNQDITDETREIALEFKQEEDGSITYRMTISIETVMIGFDANDPTREESFGSSVVIEFAANATAQVPVTATVQCAG